MNLARYLFIKEMLEFTILTVSLLAMMFLFAWSVVTSAMSDVAASALIVDKEAPPVNREVRNLNQITKNVALSSQEFAPITSRALEIISSLPPDVKLAGFNFSRKENTFNLSGTAATRAALINYEKIIEGLTWISGITIPPSQLLQKEDISFEVHGNLKGFPKLK